MKKIFILFVVICYLLHLNFLQAQHVVYSPSVGNPDVNRFEVVGKVGDNYWVHKSKKFRSYKKWNEPWLNDKNISFEIYDAKINKVRTVPSEIKEQDEKEYFITGDEYFDQLIFTDTINAIQVAVTRYTSDGEKVFERQRLLNFPTTMKANDFLMLRSNDRKKVLLLGFESMEDAAPQLHSTLYDDQWNVIYQNIIQNNNLTQPCTQYDFINYPLEAFDNSPVKLTNSGDWLMLSTSRESNNYLLFHFQLCDSSLSYNHVRLNRSSVVQDLSLSLNPDEVEAFAGILSDTRYPAVKSTHVLNYSLLEKKIEFDTTYTFKTILHKLKDENLYEQYFMPVPGKGFMFMKEYGRPFVYNYIKKPADESDDNPEDYISLVSDDRPLPVKRNDYTRYSNLSGSRSSYDRGDLSFYYFPAKPTDSTWSGIINKEQTSEFNSAYLSYVCMPFEDKLVFLYNSFIGNQNQYSSTTILDKTGNPLNEGLIFWKARNTLDFQKARQISADELVVPYDKNRMQGFAVIRLSEK